MRRYFKYIFLTLITVIFAASCIEEMESPQPMPQSDALTLVPRVKSFTNQYVTKAEGDEAAYTQAETKITHLAYLIFDRNGNLVKMDEADVQNGNGLTLNKTNLNSSETSATVVMFANVNLDDIKKEVTGEDETTSIIKITDDEELSLEGLDDYSIYLNSDPVVLSGDLSGSGFKGFPMKGNAENVNLTTASTDPIVVNLQILYAKVYFEIGVAAGTENQNYEGVTPQFEISGYSVHNVSKITTVAELGEEDATASDDYAYTGSSSKVGSLPTSSNKVASTSGNTKVDFTFYMAESCYNHGGISGVYPVGDLPEDVKQQYKPKLATNGTGLPSTGLATYVTINGKYKDYRGTEWTVNYKVYLGKNSYDDFHVDRNSEYKNFLTIKGIRNNDTYTDAGSVWIDHRVNVSTDDPSKHVTITRETLIDSHIEVRPLRVQWSGDTYAGVRVYLPTDKDGLLLDWIGMERFTGENCLDGSTYCYVYDSSTKQNVAIGKRRYFTTTLISELQSKGGEFGVQTDDNGKKFINLHNGECVWIYFDENTTPSDRPADIKLQFFDDEGKSNGEEVYQVKQSALQTVGGVSIESYEEYLHTYDSIDKYNLSTSPIDYTQQGIVWGFSGTQISKDDLVSVVSLPDWAVGILNLDFTNAIWQRYDFIHSDDGDYSAYTKKSGEWEKYSELGTGRNFTSRASETMGITIIDMATMPNNAYQYCLSKNKFKEDADGKHTMEIHWYLPDVHELQCIFNAAKVNNTSADLNTSSSYWSSQPSFTSVMPDALDGINLISENSASTRAVSVNGISDASRSLQNRIRCAYSAKAIHADMSDRAPNGMGGNNVFWMKAWESGLNSNWGYFNKLRSSKKAETKDRTITPYTYPNDKYPKPGQEIVDEKFTYLSTIDMDDNNREGFTLDPTQESSWKKYKNLLNEETEYYSTLNTYPGLVVEELERLHLNGTYRPAYKPIPKTSKQAISEVEYRKVIDINEPLSTTKYNETLDHTQNGSMFNISFSVGKGDNSLGPQYIYSELTEKPQIIPYTKTWIPPVYDDLNFTEKGGDITVTDVGADDEEIVYANTNTGYRAAQAAVFTTAYAEAQRNARDNLKNKVKELYNISLSNNDIELIPSSLKWDDPESDALRYTTRTETGWLGIKTYYVKCTVTLTAKATVTTQGEERTLFYQLDNTGKWSDQVPGESRNGAEEPGIISDNLIMYCGNSLTISLSDNTFTENNKTYRYRDMYEITKVKIHYSGGNLVYENRLKTDRIFARFIDTSIKLPIDGDGGTSVSGMEFSENEKTGIGIHQWSGKGTNEVTLVLADYNIKVESDIEIDWGNLGNSTLVKYRYTYNTASKDLSKFIIIDKIEVKCTKKATAATE